LERVVRKSTGGRRELLLGVLVTPAGGEYLGHPPGPIRLDVMTTAMGALFLGHERPDDLRAA